MDAMRSSSKFETSTKESDHAVSKLQGDDLIDFNRYQKLKVSLIIYNSICASVTLCIFVIAVWRLVTGIKHPWLFQYAFADDRVYDAVHAVEISYFPKALTYVDVIYIIAPIYASLVYSANAFMIILSAAMKSYETLSMAKNVLTIMSVPCMLMVGLFGKKILFVTPHVI